MVTTKAEAESTSATKRARDRAAEAQRTKRESKAEARGLFSRKDLETQER